MGFADRGPTPGAGSHPEQELSHASLGRGAGRAGEECRQHYTGDRGYEDPGACRAHCMQTLQGVLHGIMGRRFRD